MTLLPVARKQKHTAILQGADSTFATSVETELTEEEKIDLLCNARSIDRIVKWGSCFQKCERGILCTCCGAIFIYDFSAGEDFTGDVLPLPFRHLKFACKRHLQSQSHLKKLAEFIKEKEDDIIYEKYCREQALNCAAAAYLSYKLDTSYSSYESIVAEMHNSGARMGVKNHSKEFPRNFLPHVHSILKKEISDFITHDDLPVGLLADKMTVNHRSRHIIGIRIPVFDMNYTNLFRSIYLEHQWVDNFTGEGLCKDFFFTLKKFGFDLPFLRKNLVGVATDGQYVKLGLDKHLKNTLVRDIFLMWDPMHRLELVKKNSPTPTVVVDALTLVQDTMKEFHSGKGFELLSENANFDLLYKPKVFKSMKFISHCEVVFKTFINDFKALIASCESNPDLFSLRDRLMTKINIFNILVTTDIYSAFSLASKNVQSGDNLPWDYINAINCLRSCLGIMKYNLDTLLSVASNFEELSQNISLLPKEIFKNLKTSTEMFVKMTYKDIPLPETPVAATHTRNKMTQKEYGTFENSIKEFSKYMSSLLSGIENYFSCDNSNENVLEKINFIFNWNHLIYPNSTVPFEQSEVNKGFTMEKFASYISVFKPLWNEFSIDDLWFEFLFFNEWIIQTIDSGRKEGYIYEAKILIKKAVKDLRNKVPKIIHLMKFCISIPVSEAVCESWGSTIARTHQFRMVASDGSNTEVGTVDRRVFVLLNGPPAGFRNTRKFLKAALITMFGASYHKHFTSASASNNTISKTVTSKVVSRIADHSDTVLPCFN